VTQGSTAAPTDLRAVFLAHFEGGDGFAAPEDLDATLHLLWEDGRGAWPGITLDPACFVAHLAERVAVGPEPRSDTPSTPPDPGLEQALAEVRAADLYLACSCQHDVGGAIARFEKAFASTIAGFLRHVDPSPAFADEVRQVLLEKLFVSGKDGAPPKIAGYQGRGPLASWVGIVAQRTALSLRRGPTTSELPNDDDLGEGLPPGTDPELDYLKVRYRAEFREAFRTGFAALAPRDRMVLRLFMVKRLSHQSIAAMYHVNQSTVTRWIARARDAITAEARRYLRERLAVTTQEFDSLGQLVASQLDLSVTRWLGEE
jgi:RNA polymerase sigma-70 factor (ECF subfamily)